MSHRQIVPPREEYMERVRRWAENGIPKTVLTEGEVYSLAHMLQEEAERVLGICGGIVDKLHRELRAAQRQGKAER